MNLSSTLNSEIIRIFATILLPGVLTLLSLAMLFCAFHFPNNAAMLDWLSENAETVGKHSTVLTVFFFILAVGGGILAETIGARFEYHICDWRANKSCDNFSDVWNKYLTLKFEHDPIGQKYLRYLHLHLKFELNFAAAVLLVAISVGFMDWNFKDTSVHWLFYTVCGVGAAALLWESVSSSINLHNVRKQLVEKYDT